VRGARQRHLITVRDRRAHGVEHARRVRGEDLHDLREQPAVAVHASDRRCQIEHRDVDGVVWLAELFYSRDQRRGADGFWSDIRPCLPRDTVRDRPHRTAPSSPRLARPPVPCSRARIACVASSPFISGI
jgi:hypothetical protein